MPNVRYAVVLMSLVELTASPVPSQAIELSEHGAVATLAGRIDPGDGKIFADFLKRPRAERLRILYLSSGGGNVVAGIAIAQQVRSAGLITATDAASTYCDSMCTVIFAAGVQRHYVHGDTVFEGFGGRYGLGYHTAHYAKGRDSIKSDAGTTKMMETFRRFGQSGAIDLMERAAFNTEFHPNGATALRLGLATSLADPREASR